MGLGALQPGHLIVILVIVLLIFGPGKLPELGKSLGEGLRELKKATSGEEPTAATHATTTSTAVASPVGTLAAVAPMNPAAPGPEAMLACPSCRGSVPAGDKFCGNCGATVAGAAAEPVSRTA